MGSSSVEDGVKRIAGQKELISKRDYHESHCFEDPRRTIAKRLLPLREA
jgi:hypothetical protein